MSHGEINRRVGADTPGEAPALPGSVGGTELKRLQRRCWLCSCRLMENFTTVDTPDGKVLVHKVCERDTLELFIPVTAQIGDRTPNLIEDAERNGE